MIWSVNGLRHGRTEPLLTQQPAHGIIGSYLRQGYLSIVSH